MTKKKHYKNKTGNAFSVKVLVQKDHPKINYEFGLYFYGDSWTYRKIDLAVRRHILSALNYKIKFEEGKK